jgi:hypothetical protein
VTVAALSNSKHVSASASECSQPCAVRRKKDTGHGNQNDAGSERYTVCTLNNTHSLVCPSIGVLYASCQELIHTVPELPDGLALRYLYTPRSTSGGTNTHPTWHVSGVDVPSTYQLHSKFQSCGTNFRVLKRDFVMHSDIPNRQFSCAYAAGQAWGLPCSAST